MYRQSSPKVTNLTDGSITLPLIRYTLVSETQNTPAHKYLGLTFQTDIYQLKLPGAAMVSGSLLCF